MHADLVAVVLLPHLKQLALDGTAPFASVSFEFPLGDLLHLCRQSFCFRVHQSNEKIKLQVSFAGFSVQFMVPPFYVIVDSYGLVEDTGTVHTVLVIHVSSILHNFLCLLILIFLSASQIQVECGQRVGMEGRRLSSGTCIHCHVRCRQSVNE